MTLKVLYKKYENGILTLLFLVLLATGMGLRYDFYYDLNDDVLMKDILSGGYTGAPEGRNIQMLYLISALISFFYRVVPDAPWYGIFLCVCQFGSFGLIGARSLTFARKTWMKLLFLTAEGAIIVGAMLSHMIFVQYTVTGTLLAAAAAFLFYTTDIHLPTKAFIIRNIPAMLLIFIAYLIRSEMILLVLPLVCVAGVCKWGSERITKAGSIWKVFLNKNFAYKYLFVIGGILAGLCLGQVTHMIAHNSPEWRKFTEFFENRTELYDFQEIPVFQESEENAAFYESVGLTEGEEILLHNYNFGLDEEIDEKLLGEIAAYAAANRKESSSFGKNLMESLSNYRYRLSHGAPHGDFPWNLLVITGYAGLLVLGIRRRRIVDAGWKLTFLFVVRTALWLFILMRGRVVPRVIDSLYLMELAILCGMLLVEVREATEASTAAIKVGLTDYRRLGISVLIWGIGILFFAAGTVNIPAAIASVDQQSQRREEINKPYQAMQDYCREHGDSFFFVDVMSTVDYSEKMFAGVDNSLTNYDLMGGWACKSPLYRKKLAAFGIDSMEAALIARENVYLITEEPADLEWLTAYYRSHQEEITIELIEQIENTMGVYKIR